VRGLFLDFDGTLVDSLSALRAVYHTFLAGYGRPGSDAEFHRLNGPPLPAIIDTLRQTHGLTEPADILLARYHALIVQAFATVAPVPGARTLLERARRHGWAVAIVTSNRHALTTAWLDTAGLAGLVTTVVGGDQVARGKPDPEPYRLALARTGCTAAASLAVEDSGQGLVAALGAGLPTWLVGPAAPGPAAASPLFRGRLATLDALMIPTS
jgi:HAD superfamily hydrolase (TIGR01509 family)